jgi:hypothetical protein
VLDPAGFSVKYKLGEGRLTIMVVSGAAVAVAALWIRAVPLEPPNLEPPKLEGQ